MEKYKIEKTARAIIENHLTANSNRGNPSSYINKCNTKSFYKEANETSDLLKYTGIKDGFIIDERSLFAIPVNLIRNKIHVNYEKNSWFSNGKTTVHSSFQEMDIFSLTCKIKKKNIVIYSQQVSSKEFGLKLFSALKEYIRKTNEGILDFNFKIAEIEKTAMENWTGALSPINEIKEIIRKKSKLEVAKSSIFSAIIDKEKKKRELNKTEIIIVGGSGSGKTTLSTIKITDEIKEKIEKNEPLIFEKNEESVKEALNAQPERMKVGEIRSMDASFAMLQAANTGHTGKMTTIHLNKRGFKKSTNEFYSLIAVGDRDFDIDKANRMAKKMAKERIEKIKKRKI